jgi:multidrug transporter EmrE-like cation transporter
LEEIRILIKIKYSNSKEQVMNPIFVFPMVIAAFAFLVYAMTGTPLIKIEKHYHYDKEKKI